jgi:hypothetical protein
MGKPGPLASAQLEVQAVGHPAEQRRQAQIHGCVFHMGFHRHGIVRAFVGSLAAFAVYFYGRANDNGLCPALASAGFFIGYKSHMPEMCWGRKLPGETKGRSSFLKKEAKNFCFLGVG